MATNKILNREDIELLCSFINKIANISESIDDINLKTDGTFSSVKIDSLLKQLKEENKDYTDEQILKVKNTAIKVVTDMAETGKLACAGQIGQRDQRRMPQL